MRHIDPDAVALAALGEPLDADDRAHLADCPDCAREVATLTTTVAAGRRGGDERAVPPPPAVWERVRAELDLGPALEPGPLAGAGRADDAAPGPTAEPDAGPDAGLRVAAPVPVPAQEPAAPVTPVDAARDRRRTGGRARWLAPVAAGLVVGAVTGGLVVRQVLRDDAPAVLAEASLDALPGWSASGDAAVEEDRDGRRTLVVRLAGGEGDGFREVWLLDREATRLVGLGVLDGDEGRFTIPVGLDLDDFAVVDVSAEPFDGDPAHSGDSILRGELAARA